MAEKEKAIPPQERDSVKQFADANAIGAEHPSLNRSDAPMGSAATGMGNATISPEIKSSPANKSVGKQEK